MKKSRTQKAVDAIIRSRAKNDIWRVGDAVYRDTYKQPKILSVTAAAKRFKLNVSGLLRAVKRREKEKRCPECKQVIR